MPRRVVHTASGPDLDRTTEAGPLAALMLAQTHAERHAANETTYYVRDAAGDMLYRIERDASGVVHTYGKEDPC